MDAIDVAAPPAVARPAASPDLGVVAAPPSPEPEVERWPGWVRAAILLGGGGLLWAGLGWAVFRILKLS